MLSPMTYLILLGLLILIVFALRSFLRFRREQDALTEALRHTVAERGWTYEKNPGGNLAMRITGTSDGVAWSVEQDDGATDDYGSSITWSTGLTDKDPLLLYVADVQSIGAMRGAMGEMLFNFAAKADKQAVAVTHIQAMRDFFKNAQEHAFISPHLSMRYAALTTSQPFARQMLRAPLEKMLQEWPEACTKLQIGDVNVRIHWRTSNNFEPEDLLRLTDLGILLTKRLRASRVETYRQ